MILQKVSRNVRVVEPESTAGKGNIGNQRITFSKKMQDSEVDILNENILSIERLEYLLFGPSYKANIQGEEAQLPYAATENTKRNVLEYSVPNGREYSIPNGREYNIPNGRDLMPQNHVKKN
eukprot:jgi/Bigna1/141309/aug1.61_g16017